jgi:hypothetical protein
MSDRIGEPGCSAVTLSRADSGFSLPRRSVVEAYAEACGASRREARIRWTRAVRRGTGARAAGMRAGQRERPQSAGAARRLEMVYEPAHLLEAMHRLRLTAGRPSLRELQDRARALDVGPLPRSSVADVLAGVRAPSADLLLAYARVCGVSDRDIGAWHSAWVRAIGDEGFRSRRPADAYSGG